MALENLPDGAKLSGDLVSASIAFGTLAELLPHLAGLLTVIWSLIRIYETRTVQQVLGRRPPREKTDGE